jgi:hypothetical protein
LKSPEKPEEPVVKQNCREVAESEMTSKDLDKNGVLSEEELKAIVYQWEKSSIFYH